MALVDASPTPDYVDWEAQVAASLSIDDYRLAPVPDSPATDGIGFAGPTTASIPPVMLPAVKHGIPTTKKKKRRKRTRRKNVELCTPMLAFVTDRECCA